MVLEQSNDQLVQKYIIHGQVDYSKLNHDESLESAVNAIKTHNLQFTDEKEEFAFYINTYNLLTLYSVKIELAKNPDWKGNTSLFSKLRFFYLRRFQIGTKKMNLYALENKILRKKFKDPRLHFAINCASKSCPFMPVNLLTGANLDEILDQSAKSFINDQGGVIFQNGVLNLNRIFKWYKKDFVNGVIPFINSYWDGEPIPDTTEIKYLDYNWSLN